MSALSSMASPHNLMGLVNQLQNIESTMMAAIMEMLMKVATLTDANVFLLVDAVEGRRFAGKRHLVDAYLAGALAPVGSDVEMELDPSVTALRRRPINGLHARPPPPPSMVPLGGYRSSNGDHRHLLKRPPPPTRPGFVDGLVGDAGGIGDALALKRIRSQSLFPSPSTTSPDKPAVAGSSSVAPVSTKETSNASPKSKTSKPDSSPEKSKTLVDVKMEASVEEAEVDVKPSIEIRGFGDDERTKFVVDTVVSAGAEEERSLSGESEVEEIGEASQLDIESFEAASLGISFFDPDPPNYLGDFDILAYLDSNPKAVALHSEIRLDSIVDKTSVSHKVLTSLLYDIAKAASSHSPVRDKRSDVAKAFFNHVFETVWDSFPVLHELARSGARVRDGGRDKNLKYYMRHKLQKWFGSMLDRMVVADHASADT